MRMVIIAFLTTVVIIGIMAYEGIKTGLFDASLRLVRDLLALIVCITLAGPIALGVLSRLPGMNDPPVSSYLYVLVLGLCYGGMTMLFNQLKDRIFRTKVSVQKYADMAGGGLLGAVDGVILSGMLLIFWTLMPFVPYMPGDTGRINTRSLPLDTGSLTLKVYACVADRMPGNTPFLMDAEPVIEDGNVEAENAVEDTVGGSKIVFNDLNGNGRWDRGWLWHYQNHADLRSREVERYISNAAGSD
jgi:hypothetical protein